MYTHNNQKIPEKFDNCKFPTGKYTVVENGFITKHKTFLTNPKGIVRQVLYQFSYLETENGTVVKVDNNLLEQT